MMHCTMEDLLALRAGEASVFARKHIETCAACRAELDALYQRVAQLKALPTHRPSRDRWPVVLETVRAERTRRRRVWSVGSLAAAAVIAGVLLVQPTSTGGGLHAELAQVKQQSATLEDQLQSYDAEGRVLSGRAAALAAELEDKIADIDGVLTSSSQESELVNLWQQRVDLMQQLVSVRVTRARYVGL